MLKAGLKLISVSIKYLPASPSPSSTSLRYIPLEECVSFAAWMLGWLRVQGYQILNSSNNYWFLSKLPPSKSHPDPGRQSAGDKAYEWKMEVANTQFSSDSQPWHQTQLVKVTESLPASHPDVGLPGCLIAAGPAKRFPLRCVFRPSQAFCSLCVQLVPQRELHVLAYSPGIQQVYTHTATPMLWTNILPKTHCLNPCGSGPNNEPETSSQLRPQLHRQPAEKLWNAAIQVWWVSHTCVHPFLQDGSWGRVYFSSDKYLTPLESIQVRVPLFIIGVAVTSSSDL